MLELTAFLTMPFKKQPFKITEGWKYSEEERAIHGFEGHGGVDFELPRGTPVLAAADGLAIASYFWYEIKNPDGTPRLWKGKTVANSLGYFVQIYHPDFKLYTSYGHLEGFSPEMAFFSPNKRGDRYWPVGHKIRPHILPVYKWAVEVNKGQVIGYVGDSGLTWGYSDFPKRPDPSEFPSWDEVHLHFEVFERVGFEMKKHHLDPYGIKGFAPDYPDSSKKGSELGKEGPVLWILGSDGLPMFVE